MPCGRMCRGSSTFGAKAAGLTCGCTLQPGLLPQVHAALKDWALSEQYYLQAAQSSEVGHVAVGVAVQPMNVGIVLCSAGHLQAY